MEHIRTCLKEGFLVVPEVNSLTNNDEPLNISDVDEKYGDVFTGLGRIGDLCSIKLDENCVGFINPPRRIPFAIKDKVK